MIRSELLALSFDAAATPSVTIRLRPSDHAASGSWGLVWYPLNDPNSSLLKDTTFHGDIHINTSLPSGERLSSSIFLAHSRAETKHITRSDTQPFRRPFGRYDYTFAHAGQLDLFPDPSEQPASDWLNPSFPAAFEPVGGTDSERVFCRILQRLSDHGAPGFESLGWHTLRSWFQEANAHGTMSAVLSDGRHVIAYCDSTGAHPLWSRRSLPPREDGTLDCGNHAVTMASGEDNSRTLVVFASRVGDLNQWSEMAPGEMIVVRNGDIVWASDQAPGAAPPPRRREVPTVQSAQISEEPQPLISAQTIGSGNETSPPVPTNSTRVLSVSHETTYRYTHPVSASQHVIRLRPVHDPWQEVIDYAMDITPPGEQSEFEDVFGNHAVNLHLREPYTEFLIRMHATVRIRWSDLTAMPHERRSLPLTWMPWQRQMMHAYLLPPELPETQLRELSAYATSFMERRDHDLVETLVDMNTSIFRDYAYVSGSTTAETTPFEVYTTRQGVCQDFANLYICMARLLGIPARYRVGYIYTGSNYENKLQSDATHAWAEVYLPNVGWRGFDPTNGCLAGPDHIRVAAGRNFRDATPTSGTIFQGGSNEILTINVKVQEPQL